MSYQRKLVSIGKKDWIPAFAGMTKKEEKMFTAMQTMETQWIWSGVIWALVMGLAAGNYACSLIHRLPRGRLLLDKAPYCGTCGTLLEVKDLFPVVSAVLLGHKCRYCKTPFPISHTVTELLLASIFVFSFLRYGFGEMSVLIYVLSSFIIILAAIEVNEDLIMGKVMICIIVVGMVMRTFLDAGLFNFVQGGLFGIILGAIIWRKGLAKVGHIYRLPVQGELMAMSGLVVGAAAFHHFLLAFIVAYPAVWAISSALKKKFRITIAFSIAIGITVFLS